MTYFALHCEIDHSKERLLEEKRAEHLAYLKAHKSKIHFGGPLLAPDGSPKTGLLILAVESAEEATAFIQSEPYYRSGVFTSFTVQRWIQVMP